MTEIFTSSEDYQKHRVSDYHIKFKQQTADCIASKNVAYDEQQIDRG